MDRTLVRRLPERHHSIEREWLACDECMNNARYEVQQLHLEGGLAAHLRVPYGGGGMDGMDRMDQMDTERRDGYAAVH